jgi:hypothetical protein
MHCALADLARNINAAAALDTNSYANKEESGRSLFTKEASLDLPALKASGNETKYSAS